jgi:hypothetical protein
VATNSPLPQRIWKLLQVAATQQRDSRELVKIRCERGSFIAKKLGFSDAVAAGIHSLDEHWNGGGYPNHLHEEEVPLFSRIANLSQTLEVFFAARGPHAAIHAVRQRSGRWFDPELVKAAEPLCTEASHIGGTCLENRFPCQPVFCRWRTSSRCAASEAAISRRAATRKGFRHLARRFAPSSGSAVSRGVDFIGLRSQFGRA